MKSTFKPLILCGLLAVAAVQAAHAGKEVIDTKTEAVLFSPFDRGMREFQISAGALFSLNNRGEKRPTIDDVDLSLRLGWMLNTPSGESCLRGNFEFLAEAFGGAVVDGPGDGLGGITLLLRYNFVQPATRWVPYFQVGAGGVYSNIYEDHVQRLIGRSVEFNLQAGLGLRYICSERCSVFVEADYRHISNADTADRNLGLNSIGGLIGAGFSF
ncbi:MAG: ompW [Chthoniobacteraceae bacterium]|nr:ompW [Chthoniobacteraceae bacterium]